MNNASNPKFNEKDVENKLKGFKEGADYSVLRENGNKFYNFHNDFLKSMLGTSHWNTVYEVAENWDSDNFNYRRENAEYVSKNGGKIIYSYEHKVNKNGGYYEWMNSENREPQSGERLSITARPPSRRDNYLEDFKQKHRDLTDKLNYYLSEPQSRERDEKIEMIKRDITELESKIEHEKNCHCRGNSCKNLVKNDASADLIKENEKLKQQLAELQKQLVQIAAELKKLKGESSEKLAAELAQVQEDNEKLTKNGKVSASEVANQVNKTKELVRKVNASQVGVMTTSASVPANDLGKTDNSSAFPYVGGALLVGLTLTFGYYLVNRKKK